MAIDESDKNVTLKGPSESDAQELISMFSKATLTNGRKLAVTRDEPVTTIPPTTTPTPSHAGSTAIQVTEVVYKRMDVMLTKHTKASNHNFTTLHKSIEKLQDRQDATEKRQEQQDALMTGLFDQLRTWREQPKYSFSLRNIHIFTTIIRPHHATHVHDQRTNSRYIGPPTKIT